MQNGKREKIKKEKTSVWAETLPSAHLPCAACYLARAVTGGRAPAVIATVALRATAQWALVPASPSRAPYSLLGAAMWGPDVRTVPFPKSSSRTAPQNQGSAGVSAGSVATTLASYATAGLPWFWAYKSTRAPPGASSS
jgi:hypothetical protein